MVTKSLNCAKCGMPIEHDGGPGRPPTYCSATCKRLVEFELRRLDRRLANYALELREELADRLPARRWVDNLGRDRDQRIADLKTWIAADEERLAQLLSGNVKEQP